MAVEFRCERCGKLLAVEAQPGQKVKCPHCTRSTSVPEGLANLPRPQVAAAAGAAGAAGTAPPPPPPEETEAPEEEISEGDVFVTAMSRIMPFVISIFFHIGIAMIFVLLYFVAVEATEDEDMQIVVPDAVLSEDPGGMLTKTPTKQKQQQSKQQSRVQSPRESPVPQESGKTDQPVRVGAAGAAGGRGDAMIQAGGGGGPRSSFMGSGGRAYHICYVIDRSGSMMDTFDLVTKEMMMSIARLKEVQDFHVLFFNDGPPLENPPKMLVPATAHNKALTGRFLQKLIAQGQTDPIPALERAFAVLDRADKRRPGKLVYLLTDGVFPNNDRVIGFLATRNRDKSVHINTFLYGSGGPARGEQKQAAKVLQKIADAHGGDFRLVGGMQ